MQKVEVYLQIVKKIKRAYLYTSMLASDVEVTRQSNRRRLRDN